MHSLKTRTGSSVKKEIHEKSLLLSNVQDQANALQVEQIMQLKQDITLFLKGKRFSNKQILQK